MVPSAWQDAVSQQIEPGPGSVGPVRAAVVDMSVPPDQVAADRDSMRLSQEELAEVWSISTLRTAAREPARRHRFVVRCGESLSHTIAVRISGG
ncbi:hypothetical protein OOK39_05715 [Streptomyces sp. NBC_00264]|uniref:hypothetical protein n=1 Tax=unclassified Streptomyces TaxID=2593676 RepID=UPI0022549702|nr:hypothetical protein [Streptomyces sp. NBC_01767]MCX5099237.1 hypothetical protein [Streptomyces sp. NBC_00439]MCX5158782.1 hypothetical protein [Streptomyces sp. NBC_00305]MCX5217305.1 hypothetical protein [Streptomyces sp. NBC_00264]WSX00149.1 hypothetical protein OG355_06755 [Streptomyces sp. NBC_00987]